MQFQIEQVGKIIEVCERFNFCFDYPISIQQVVSVILERTLALTH